MYVYITLINTGAVATWLDISIAANSTINAVVPLATNTGYASSTSYGVVTLSGLLSTNLGAGTEALPTGVTLASTGILVK